ACKRTSSSRTACMATRRKASLKVVTKPTTSVSPRCRNRCSAQAPSFPELQDRSTLGFKPVHPPPFLALKHAYSHREGLHAKIVFRRRGGGDFQRRAARWSEGKIGS